MIDKGETNILKLIDNDLFINDLRNQNETIIDFLTVP